MSDLKKLGIVPKLTPEAAIKNLKAVARVMCKKDNNKIGNIRGTEIPEIRPNDAIPIDDMETETPEETAQRIERNKVIEQRVNRETTKGQYHGHIEPESPYGKFRTFLNKGR